MHKFFVDSSCIERDTIRINGDDVLHINKVLRLRQGDQVLINDSKGKEYVCVISSSDKKTVTCSIIKVIENQTEPSVKVHLFQGIPKSAKMDLIVQKCTELGVQKITPVITERVVVKVDESNSRLIRWQKIAEEAAKQSNRGVVPDIDDVCGFKDALKKMSSYDLSIIPYEKENNRGLKSVLQGVDNLKTIGILIGPEGGFTEDEVASAVKDRVLPVTLGPRILRTETAGFTALTIVLYEIGDMGGKP